MNDPTNSAFSLSDFPSSDGGFDDNQQEWGDADATLTPSPEPEAFDPEEAQAIFGVLQGADRARAQVGALLGRLTGVIDRTESEVGARSFEPLDIYAVAPAAETGLDDDL